MNKSTLSTDNLNCLNLSGDWCYVSGPKIEKMRASKLCFTGDIMQEYDEHGNMIHRGTYFLTKIDSGCVLEFFIGDLGTNYVVDIKSSQLILRPYLPLHFNDVERYKNAPRTIFEYCASPLLPQDSSRVYEENK